MLPLPLTLITITKADPAGLALTIESAARLRAHGAEHIVVDGNPVENAAHDATSSNRDASVRFMHRAPRGLADAFNAGIAAAQREWVWCLNGGDRVDARLTPEFLHALLEATRADILIGGTTYEGEAEPRPHPAAHLRWPPVRSWIPHPSTLVRRKLFTQFGAFDEHYTIAMDYEWWLRVIPAGAAVDVSSAPFAVFAAGGMSQQPENLPVLQREKRAALRKHFGTVSRSWASVNARLWKAWAFAALGRRLRKSVAAR